MPKDSYYIKIAEAVSLNSPCLKKHYGAIIVKDDTIVATGYNGPPRGEAHCEHCTKKQGKKDFDEYCSCPAVHAEMNAIIAVNREQMNGATLYLAGYDLKTNSFIAAYPCEICLRLIKNAGIAAVKNSDGLIFKRDKNNILVSDLGEV